ncbi:hypothetical protein LNI88_11765 [Tenacibaculum dicentrarchi]|uniref:hypothetical protein n=1 Tax=Tenacibaculum finnmarkense TaxID=2781243 RepID=UPI001E5222BA|nr:hypothetical protein [Tenacibaculum finnmarkense]MCD8406223.1 hypothetical protein [Tenacibaculum dicentrarchi]MCD8425984.1 hypothetical protein [Tenacibaculum dicentrarchi]MCD8443267.1 hypothetical protein [Tenacibaculum dicentrarchi]WCC46201.1 hypothetical protein PJH08_07265 [Tenacibaculum finnmarkense]
MKNNQIEIIKLINKNSILQRFGGNSFLPEFIEWPINSNNEKLTLVFSIPTSFLNNYCNTALEKNKFLSVFSTYNEDYFLDEVIDNGDIFDETEKIFGDFTQVLLHDKGNTRNESNYIIPSYLIEIITNNEYSFENSKLGGEPIYLQNEVEEAKVMKFCFQFYAGNLPKFKNILFLEDAISYLFVSNKGEKFNGLFFGQCT